MGSVTRAEALLTASARVFLVRGHILDLTGMQGYSGLGDAAASEASSHSIPTFHRET